MDNEIKSLQDEIKTLTKQNNKDIKKIALCYKKINDLKLKIFKLNQKSNFNSEDALKVNFNSKKIKNQLNKLNKVLKENEEILKASKNQIFM